VFDSGDAGGDLWFTMPYVEGESLRERLRRERQLPISEAVRIAMEAARALEFAHRHGVIHRDIKPENLLLTSDGSTLVADFGVARALDQIGGLTETGVVVGTPAYMSPEQAAGDRTIGPRTDIYSLACVLYEMLAGEPPYTGPNPQALLARRLSEPVPHLRPTRDVSPAVEQTVMRALSRSPADRYATAGDLAAALQAADSGAASAVKLAESRSRPSTRLWLLGGGLVAVLVVAVAVWGRSRARTPEAATTAAVPASAAVLPFADLSPGHDQEYFSDGLTDELITALSKVDGLRVAARTSSFQYKGHEVDVRQVGRQLDVGSVLEGSVRRSGNRVRISAQLVSARDGYQLWADAYDRDLADVFAVQEDIARSIVGALKVHLGGRAATRLATRPTQDLEAHDLYLKGRFAWNQRSVAGMREAVRYLEQAIARDPSFAQAQAALASAYLLVGPYSGAPLAESWAKSKAAAARALALDSTLAEAHTARAYGAMIYDWDWPASEASFRRAIAADSTYPTAHQWYGNFLWSRGRLDEALQQMEVAHRLDPLSRIIGTEMGQTLYLMHRYDEAEKRLKETLDLDPNYPHALYILGLIHVQQRRHAEGIAEMRRSVELGGFQEDLAGGLAYAYGVSGDRASFNKLVAELEKRMANGSFGPFPLALAYTGLGETTRAFEYLNRAIDVHDIFLPEDFFDPQLDPLRRDSRFAKVEERMGVRPHSPSQ
jgi:TolB-like protein/Tfp pilus assembly protein PilF